MFNDITMAAIAHCGGRMHSFRQGSQPVTQPEDQQGGMRVFQKIRIPEWGLARFLTQQGIELFASQVRRIVRPSRGPAQAGVETTQGVGGHVIVIVNKPAQLGRDAPRADRDNAAYLDFHP